MSERRSAELRRTLKRLKVGDIMMVHTKRPVSGWIRRSTKSFWSHVALVFEAPKDRGFGNDILIIEALEGTGVQLHRLSTFLNNPWRYEIGFKRMKHLTDEERDRFRGFFLDLVDTPYDLNRLGAYFLSTAIKKVAKRDYSARLARRNIDPKKLICTTFAQRAYYLAVAPEKRAQVLFRGHDPSIGFLEQMEIITPKDIAASPATEWLYNKRA